MQGVCGTYFEREEFYLVIISRGGEDVQERSVLSRAIESDRHMLVRVLTHTVNMPCYLEVLSEICCARGSRA
jgi:hypothetical protein